MNSINILKIFGLSYEDNDNFLIKMNSFFQIISSILAICHHLIELIFYFDSYKFYTTNVFASYGNVKSFIISFVIINFCCSVNCRIWFLINRNSPIIKHLNQSQNKAKYLPLLITIIQLILIEIRIYNLSNLHINPFLKIFWQIILRFGMFSTISCLTACTVYFIISVKYFYLDCMDLKITILRFKSYLEYNNILMRINETIKLYTQINKFWHNIIGGIYLNCILTFSIMLFSIFFGKTPLMNKSIMRFAILCVTGWFLLPFYYVSKTNSLVSKARITLTRNIFIYSN